MENNSIIILMGFIGTLITVITPIIKLNSSITKLNVTIDNINSSLTKCSTKIDEQEKTISDHNLRIDRLERTKA